MSATLVFRWLTPIFALAVAATVFVVGGPLAAGLAMVTFLLGLVTSELHHMRWTPVETSAASDSAFLALLEAGGASIGPAGPPKRNYRATCDGLAIGSGGARTELTARRRIHAAGGAPRRPATPASPSSPHALPEPVSFRANYAERVTEPS